MKDKTFKGKYGSLSEAISHGDKEEIKEFERRVYSGEVIALTGGRK